MLNVHLGAVQFSSGLSGGLAASQLACEQQLERLLALVRESPGPLLVAGDFNTPPRGQVYRRLQEPLTDAFGAAGLGFGDTFPAGFPLWRIDHVFVRGVRPLSAQVLASGGSNHRPLLTVLGAEP